MAAAAGDCCPDGRFPPRSCFSSAAKSRCGGGRAMAVAVAVEVDVAATSWQGQRWWRWCSGYVWQADENEGEEDEYQCWLLP